MPRPAHPGKSRSWPVVTAAFLALALAVSAAVTVALTGFSTTGFTMAGLSVPALSVGPTAAVGPTTGDDALGRCWQAARADITEWTSWQGDEPVPCAGDHTLYTFAVEKLSRLPGTSWATDADPTETEQSDTGPSDSGRSDAGASDTGVSEVRPEVSEAVSGKCEAAVAELLPASSWKQQRISTYSFLPTESEWASGERWVRCDIGVLGLGSLRDAPQLGNLPRDIQTLATDLAAKPAKYYYCLALPDGESADGPFAPGDAVIVSCLDQPDWRLTGREELAEPDDAAYPLGEALTTLASTACGTTADWLAAGPTTAGWVEYPSEETWSAGSREIRCWLAAE